MVGWQLVGFPGPRMSNRDDLTAHFGEAFRPKPISLEQAIGRKVRTTEDADTGAGSTFTPNASGEAWSPPNTKDQKS
jgi:hypothetical protein